jgi:hypothetical protein
MNSITPKSHARLLCFFPRKNRGKKNQFHRLEQAKIAEERKRHMAPKNNMLYLYAQMWPNLTVML